VGTLRYVTGEMPKGKTVIKTPTATLVLRGTDVTVTVHPDGTTDATVNEGSVDARNDVVNSDANLVPGQGLTLGAAGNRPFSGSNGPGGFGGDGRPGGPPEHRRSGQPGPSGNSGHSSGESDGGL
jgi:hypothetical protein